VSDVTNLILIFSTTETDLREMDPALDRLVAVNQFFDEGFGLVSVHDARLPNAWYGGSKHLETEIAIGAMNHLDLDAFLNHVRSVEWAYPYAVQVVVQGQQEWKFRLIDAFPDADVAMNRFWEKRP
jgi:hypothetical protein